MTKDRGTFSELSDAIMNEKLEKPRVMGTRSFSTAMQDWEKSLDITGAEQVELTIRSDGSIMWVNVDGTLALRVCRIKAITIKDERPEGQEKARETLDRLVRGFWTGKE